MTRPTVFYAEAETLADSIGQRCREDLGSGRPGPGVRGRPPLDAGRTEHSPTLHVRLPKPPNVRLHDRADAAGRTVSDVVREILEEH